MTTRRDIISGLGIIGIIAAGKAPAAVVKSMLGTGGIKQVGAIEMPTAADYVQDGLIAMWDGIENIGYGQHDDSATNWVDLTGNNNDAEEIVEGLYFDRNSLVYDNILSACWRVVSPSSALKNLMAGYATDDDPTKGMHIECIFKKISAGDNSSICGDSQYRYGLRFAEGKGYRLYINIGSQHGTIYQANTPYIYCLSYFFQDWTVPNVVGRHRRGWYERSVLKQDTGVIKQSVNKYNVNEFNFGFCKSNYSQSPLKGNLYCLRIYNRVLDKEEVAYNYTIDKERFGL